MPSSISAAISQNHQGKTFRMALSQSSRRGRHRGSLGQDFPVWIAHTVPLWIRLLQRSRRHRQPAL